jgi:hypothetical protein
MGFCDEAQAYTVDRSMTTLKTILFMLLVPGLLLVGLPLYLFQTDPALFSFGIFRWLAVALDDDNNSIADSVAFSSGNDITANQPQLIIYYSVP